MSHENRFCLFQPRPTVVFAASLTEAQARITEHESNFGVQFRRHKNPKNFGRSDWRSVLPKKKVSSWCTFLNLPIAIACVVLFRCIGRENLDIRYRSLRPPLTTASTNASTVPITIAAENERGGLRITPRVVRALQSRRKLAALRGSYSRNISGSFRTRMNFSDPFLPVFIESL